ncbi:hypothetical protein T06_3677 [Trichinella sp. T6]|nr:hypothetical protein T06_3677 [Trichinella sp. T6]
MKKKDSSWPLKFRVVRSRGNGEFPISANTLQSCLFGSLIPYSPMQLPVNCMECYGTFTDLQAKSGRRGRGAVGLNPAAIVKRARRQRRHLTAQNNGRSSRGWLLTSCTYDLTRRYPIIYCTAWRPVIELRAL